MRRVLASICVVFVLACFIVLQIIKVKPPDFSAWEWEQIIIMGKVINKELRSSERGETLVVTILPYEGTAVENNKSNEIQQETINAGGKILCYLNDLSKEPMMGSFIKISGKLKSFERATNPGQFSAAEFYQILKTDFRLYNAEILIETVEYSRYRELLYQLKIILGQTLDAYFSEGNAGTLRAMLLGERGQTDAEIKALFQRNGIVHILTISGLHISIIGMGFYKLIRRIAVPIFIASPLAIGLMISYGIMTSMSASSFRAIVMFGLRMAAGLVKRTYDLQTALAVAAILILFEQPLYLFHSGFLFSFLAVLAIGLFIPVMKYKEIEKKPPDRKFNYVFKAVRKFGLFKNYDSNNPGIRIIRICNIFLRQINSRLAITIHRLKRKYPYLRKISPLAKLKDAFVTCLMISICTLPIYFIFYYEFPLYSVILNLIIIPPMTLLMITGILTMTIGILSETFGKITAVISTSILDFYEWACGICDRLPYNSLIVGKPAPWQVMIYCAVLLFIIFAHKKLKPAFKYVILLFAVGMLLIRLPLNLTITFLDVGQGEAIFIATPDRRYYLIDGGSGTVSGVGEYRILPFLKSQGVSRLDGWFITHPHADHYSGFPELAAKMNYGGVKISNLILPGIDIAGKNEEFNELENIALAAGIKTIYMSQGQSIELLASSEKKYGTKEKINLHCLNPVAGFSWAPADANAFSLVLLLEYGDFSLLLTGDIEGIGERELKRYIENKGIATHLAVLSVAHHGSRNSTDEEFLALTTPEYAIISAGLDNSYGHPHRDLLGRLEEKGVEFFITFESGAITIKTDGMKMRVEEFLK